MRRPFCRSTSSAASTGSPWSQTSTTICYRRPRFPAASISYLRARGYKPDGTLFRYLIANAGVAVPEILHSGQSQHTDMVGGKPLGLTVTWINRRNLELHPSVPKPDYAFPDRKSLLSLLAGSNEGGGHGRDRT
jgi:hypothetical protein